MTDDAQRHARTRREIVDFRRRVRARRERLEAAMAYSAAHAGHAEDEMTAARSRLEAVLDADG